MAHYDAILNRQIAQMTGLYNKQAVLAIRKATHRIKKADVGGLVTIEEIIADLTRELEGKSKEVSTMEGQDPNPTMEDFDGFSKQDLKSIAQIEARHGVIIDYTDFGIPAPPARSAVMAITNAPVQFKADLTANGDQYDADETEEGGYAFAEADYPIEIEDDEPNYQPRVHKRYMEKWEWGLFQIPMTEVELGIIRPYYKAFPEMRQPAFMNPEKEADKKAGKTGENRVCNVRVSLTELSALARHRRKNNRQVPALWTLNGKWTVQAPTDQERRRASVKHVRGQKRKVERLLRAVGRDAEADALREMKLT